MNNRLLERRIGFVNCPLLIFEKTNEVIQEGLIKSYNADFIVNTLKNRFYLTSNWKEYLNNIIYQGYIKTDSSTLRFGKRDKETSVIELIIPNNTSDIDRITKFIEACGWYKATQEVVPQCKNGDILLIFEKKYQIPLKNDGVQVPNILYHITQKCYLEKIKERGLIPKSGNKLSKHPERIYFLTSKPREDILWKIAKQFFIRNDSNEYVERNVMVLLTIDISKVKKKLKFFSDPNADECVYTYDNINPNLIIKIEKIKGT